MIMCILLILVYLMLSAWNSLVPPGSSLCPQLWGASGLSGGRAMASHVDVENPWVSVGKWYTWWVFHIYVSQYFYSNPTFFDRKRFKLSQVLVGLDLVGRNFDFLSFFTDAMLNVYHHSILLFSFIVHVSWMVIYGIIGDHVIKWR